MIENKIEALIIKHKEISKSCDEGRSNYLDDISMNKMKQEKLFLKDQIERLKKEIR